GSNEEIPAGHSVKGNSRPVGFAERIRVDLLWPPLCTQSSLEVPAMRNVIGTCAIALMLGTGFVGAAVQSGAKEEAKKAGSATKGTGKGDGDGGKHAGKATAKATKKGARTVKRAVTGDAHATCVDGTRTEGKTEAAASAVCSTHGGVARK